ncbi:MAG: hypothetical protein QME52_03710 [Bacteroidota bacterium]|nr:hypothetical protein [Bacteroidota bacterium]
MIRSLTLIIVSILVFSASGCAQKKSNDLNRFILNSKIESKALKGNLIGDPSVREMLILLPPSYFSSKKVQYPSIYLLHGLGKRNNGHREYMSLLEHVFSLMKEKKYLT